jgi:hypothetical protein
MNTLPLLLAIFLTLTANACPIFNSNGRPVQNLGDPLFEVLKTAQDCPTTVIEFRSLLEAEGARFQTTMVANRGFHNPKLGSFSFFEMVESPTIKKDELFFGHFTAPGSNGTLTLDQRPNEDSLMIELIAWDRKTRMYNFYELIGGSQGPSWFYRGNSENIWSDVSKLHLNNSPTKPAFGKSLRCSGCHVSGGPIMKEFSMPHDSWWSKERQLPFGKLVPDDSVQKVMASLQDPVALSSAVASGIAKVTDTKIKKERNVKVALRPLFCPEELQLRSSPFPLQNGENDVVVPLGFFLDERLGAQKVTRAAKAHYLNALKQLGSQFPETQQIDGDHGWITPVKAASDIAATGSKWDREFISDVLAVDMTRPLFSNKRCQLLRMVPEQWSENWHTQFEDSLKKSDLASAKELLENLTNENRNAEYHRAQAQLFIEKCAEKLKAETGVWELVRYLGQLRAEAFASEISKNPMGQILEPGFRVIFAVFNPTPKPWSQSLDKECNLRSE